MPVGDGVDRTEVLGRPRTTGRRIDTDEAPVAHAEPDEPVPDREVRREHLPHIPRWTDLEHLPVFVRRRIHFGETGGMRDPDPVEPDRDVVLVEAARQGDLLLHFLIVRIDVIQPPMERSIQTAPCPTAIGCSGSGGPPPPTSGVRAAIDARTLPSSEMFTTDPESGPEPAVPGADPSSAATTSAIVATRPGPPYPR